MQKILIKNKKIEQFHRPFVIAELGLSHEGSLGVAIKMIDECASAGADAVKFQMHLSDYESSKYETFRVSFTKQDKKRKDYWNRTSFNFNEWKILKKYCEKKKIIFLCSPFSLEAVKILNLLKIDAWKIASGEINNMLLLDYILETSLKPIILSTGLSYEKEILKVINYLKNKNKNLVLLQCVSSYPCEINTAGHNLINEFNKKFNVLSGMSDHTGSLNSLISSVFFGASVIETHVVYTKKYFGPDSGSSITFDELRKFIEFIDDFFLIKKSFIKKNKITKYQLKLRKLFNKSLFLKKELKKGDMINKKDLIDKKPIIGIPAYDYKKIIGKVLNKDKKENDFLNWHDFKKK